MQICLQAIPYRPVNKQLRIVCKINPLNTALHSPGKDWMPLSSRLRDTSHYLSELPTDRDFLIRVRAENDYGISEPTEPLWLPRARGRDLLLRDIYLHIYVDLRLSKRTSFSLCTRFAHVQPLS